VSGSPFALFGVDRQYVDGLVAGIGRTLDSQDVAEWQRLYDHLGTVPYSRPRFQWDTPLMLTGDWTSSILAHCEPIPRDEVPSAAWEEVHRETGLGHALRLYVERTAAFSFHGGDELHGVLIDQLQGAGLVSEEPHLKELQELERFFFATRGGIPEPLAFLGGSDPIYNASLLPPPQVAELLRIEHEYGLFGHLAAEVPRMPPSAWQRDQARTFTAVLPFIRLVHATGLDLYYREAW